MVPLASSLENTAALCPIGEQCIDPKTDVVRLFPSASGTESMAVSDDGLLFNCDGDSKTVTVFEIESGRKRAEWMGGVGDWKWHRPGGIVVMSEFVCISDRD